MLAIINRHRNYTSLIAAHSIRKISSNATWFDRYFGIEIELILPKQQITLNHNDLHFYLMNIPDIHNEHNMLFQEWQIKKDITLHIDADSNDLLGFEIISPKLLYNQQTKCAIDQICNILSNHPLNATLNVSCGFHVHCDATYLSLTETHQIALNYHYFERVIDGYMNTSRRNNNNQHAKSLNFLDHEPMLIPSSKKAMDLYLNPEGKTYKLNFCALKSHHRCNTIENRHHMASMDAQEMLNWVKFNLLFIHHSVHSEMKRDVGMDTKTKERVLWIHMDDVRMQHYFQNKIIDDDLWRLDDLNRMNAETTTKLTLFQKLKMCWDGLTNS